MSGLMWASAYGHAKIVNYLLSLPQPEVNALSEDGWSSLMCAAHHAHSAVATMLLEAKADIEISKISH